MRTRSPARRPGRGIKERQREAAATAILEAAEQVVAERGLANTSAAAIAKQAGVAVGTLYNYFDDREQLLAAWVQMRQQELVPRIQAAAVAHPELRFDRRLRQCLVDVLALFEERRQYIRVMAAMDPRVLELKNRQTAVVGSIVAAFEQILRPAVPELAEEYARMLVGMIRGIALWRSEQNASFAGDADLIADTFLKGIARR